MEKTRLDIMLPVYHGNLEEIPESVNTQVRFFNEKMKDYDWRIVLAINGENSDRLLDLAKALNRKDKRITYNYVEKRGKGRAIINAWRRSTADVISYMDIDLSSDIRDFPNLVFQICEGYDISIGSRFHPLSKVQRSIKRRIVSFAYHKLFMKIVLGAKSFTDGQCGFKAVNQRVVREMLPFIRNRNWFFESEMLYIAQKMNFKIKEIPVHWKESEFSGILLYKAIFEFIRCGIGLRFRKFG